MSPGVEPSKSDAHAGTGALVPSLAEFLAWPAERVAAVAPQTMFVAPGGTRREAVLAGVASDCEEYPRFSRARMNECMDVIFGLGVRHVFLNMLRPSPLSEVGHYRRRLLHWAEQGVVGPEPLADYARRGWRVRIVGADDIPELMACRQRLIQETPANAAHTLWYVACSTPESHWSSIFEAARTSGARTRAELIRALYGEDIPPATLCLSWGKPMIAADIVPLLLAGELQCYWTQRPGFAQGERTLRHILYDYAYTRRTWVSHKAQRYADVPAQRWLWEQPRVLGLGKRVGPFWYPADDSLCG
jgi:hypothetical protein